MPLDSVLLLPPNCWLATASKVQALPSCEALHCALPAITRPAQEPLVGVGPVKMIGAKDWPCAISLLPGCTAR